MNKNDGSEKVALVTGASQRIGAAIARRAHRAGYRVFIHYRSSASSASRLADELNRERPDSAACGQADFSAPDSCSELIASCIGQWGQLDLLVNNASEFFPTPLGSITVDNLEKTFAANVFAPLLLVQAAGPHLQSTGGCIVNVVDIYAHKVHRDHAVYCASKAALAMLTKSLAVELAPAVRVNGIAPGAILWPEGEVGLTEEKKSAALAKVPLKRMGSAEQIAAAVMYFSSIDASFITGQILPIDGGRTL